MSLFSRCLSIAETLIDRLHENDFGKSYYFCIPFDVQSSLLYAITSSKEADMIG